MDRHRVLMEQAVNRFTSRTDRSSISGCWPWTGRLTEFGYGVLNVAGRTVIASVFAWEQASGGRVPAGLRICHTCDEPACVRNDDYGIYIVGEQTYERRGHLWLGSQSANMLDASAKHRLHGWARRVGERASRARLTSAQVLDIRERHTKGESYLKLAAAFSVGKTTIEAIVTRRSWAHV